ncbi:DsbC family protein [Dasania sp. GY-MA-18]|uniref:Thiol:disulfide interchange protein n=1 Tax=Dasania phycosphaerae TaxID=2950436 RepID=A0A9J6RKB7_9GAMM|nr:MULTISPECIES: DsbC family protein [Dasania]MCR8922712.1 DsbC family protein [Dasania sp. GY-MA-18]MCZ0865142.1 DsbC family protein [Dasania phycosphaerae]MCZ0868868.1 DsbC family protein [Dasania phycosphaerae]
MNNFAAAGLFCLLFFSTLAKAEQGLVSNQAVAQTMAQSVTQHVSMAEQAVRQQMAANFPLKEVRSVTPIADGRLYQVEFASGLLLYALPSAEYFLAGNLYQSTATGVLDLSQQLKRQQRAQLLAQLQPNEYLALSPELPAQAVIYVVVDVDCYYCQFQHQESPLLVAQGIEVRYLSLNRQRPGSSAYHKVRRTWCTDQPQQALDMLMQGRSLAEKHCTAGLMDKHIALAKQLGVERLPAVLTADGRLISGLLRVPQIFNLLGITPTPEAETSTASSLEVAPIAAEPTSSAL